MGENPLTQSEQLFEELCKIHNVPCTRLPILPDSPQPDYEIRLAGRTIVVEVKQLDPNADDARARVELDRYGMVVQSGDPNCMAERTRKQVSRSRTQFTAYHSRNLSTPAVLVLLDATGNPRDHTDPYFIQTAMFGWEQVVMEKPSGGASPAVLERGFAPRNNAAIRRDNNTHLSAIATLHERWGLGEPHERFLSLCFYHNPYAVHSFTPDWWEGAHIRHCTLEEKERGEFQNWKDPST